MIELSRNQGWVIERQENMKILKKGMRIWITTASVFSFMAGWIFFAHAGKPAPLPASQPAQSAPVQSQPSRSFNNSSQTGVFPFSFQSQPQSFVPRLRTGGS